MHPANEIRALNWFTGSKKRVKRASVIKLISQRSRLHSEYLTVTLPMVMRKVLQATHLIEIVRDRAFA